MEIAVVGGGINGLCCAWELARRGHTVELFERDEVVGATSSASTKLLHGGLRYLEHLELRLVREALVERRWWLDQVPEHTRTLALWLPIYADGPRRRWRIGLGLWLYDRLAGTANLGPHRWLDRDAVLAHCPDLDPAGLRGGFRFYEGQMDDRALGHWLADQARAAGALLHVGQAVERVHEDGRLVVGTGARRFDRIVNAAGPWAVRLLADSGLRTAVGLDLVRGSHLVCDRECRDGCLLQAPDGRVVFVLPYHGQTLIGTTEVRQSIEEPIACSADEEAYLLAVYNSHFVAPLTASAVISRFAGLRPLIRSAAEPGRATREYLIERRGALVNVYGGKWTTARALGRAVADAVAHDAPGLLPSMVFRRGTARAETRDAT